MFLGLGLALAGALALGAFTDLVSGCVAINVLTADVT